MFKNAETVIPIQTEDEQTQKLKALGEALLDFEGRQDLASGLAMNMMRNMMR